MCDLIFISLIFVPYRAYNTDMNYKDTRRWTVEMDHNVTYCFSSVRLVNV